MMILHTLASLAPDRGGPSRSVPALCSALLRQGIRADVATPDRSGSEAFARLLRRRVKTDGIALVHDHGIWLPSNHAVASISRRMRVPLVISPRGMLEPWALRHRRWKKRAAWWTYQRRDLLSADLLHATAESEAESFRRVRLHQPIAVVPNGVELPTSLRKRCARDVRTALFLSRVHPKKGLPDLIRAWSDVRAPGWRLVIAGPDEGGHRAEVEREVAAEGLAEVVRFLGPIPAAQRWEVYADADLFVLPTRSENFGLVVAEALACEVPVITTRAAPWQGLLTHRCGWWIELGIEPLAAALRDATTIGDEARRAMGRRGRAFVETEFSWEIAASEMSRVYEWILHGGTRPSSVHFD